jgi:cellulase/cellobiase CelA1
MKFTEHRLVTEILQSTNGTSEYKHGSGEISQVRLEAAGMGTRRVRITNLPPEMSSSTIRTALTPYGAIQSINEETWSNNYRYIVSSGIRVIIMALKNTFLRT